MWLSWFDVGLLEFLEDGIKGIVEVEIIPKINGELSIGIGP